MLVTFSCNAHENIVMFGRVAKKMLNLMGNSGAVPGAILAEDVPDALARLQQAILVQERPKAIGDDDDKEPEVSLALRAFPLIALLTDAVKYSCDVLWDHD